MPVLVSLQKLVQMPESKSLWPEQLRAFAEQLEANPTDRHTWAVLADWLDESEQAESSLAKACRIIARRKNAKIENRRERCWTITDLPTICGSYISSYQGILKCAAEVADNIDAALAELEKAIEGEVETFPPMEPEPRTVQGPPITFVLGSNVEQPVEPL